MKEKLTIGEIGGVFLGLLGFAAILCAIIYSRKFPLSDIYNSSVDSLQISHTATPLNIKDHSTITKILATLRTSEKVRLSRGDIQGGMGYVHIYTDSRKPHILSLFKLWDQRYIFYYGRSAYTNPELIDLVDSLRHN